MMSWTLELSNGQEKNTGRGKYKNLKILKIKGAFLVK